MTRVQPAPDWYENLMAAWRRLADEKLGPAIAGDAYRFCPKDTEALADSVEHHMNGDVLVIKATGSDERTYAAYVEMGHRVFHPSTGIVGPEEVPAEPFLRPALYQIRRL